jgi:hypothetical protein
MDNILSLSIIIIVICFVLYMFISSREKLTDRQCNHLYFANNTGGTNRKIKGKICLGDPIPTFQHIPVEVEGLAVDVVAAEAAAAAATAATRISSLTAQINDLTAQLEDKTKELEIEEVEVARLTNKLDDADNKSAEDLENLQAQLIVAENARGTAADLLQQTQYELEQSEKNLLEALALANEKTTCPALRLPASALPSPPVAPLQSAPAPLQSARAPRSVPAPPQFLDIPFSVIDWAKTLN